MKAEYLEQLQGEIEASRNHTLKLEERYANATAREEVTEAEFKKEFYKAIQNEPSKIEITIKHEKYEHILGGDGRSAPWSEQREGAVAYVKSSIFLNFHGWHYTKDGLDYKKFIKQNLEIEGVKETNFEN